MTSDGKALYVSGIWNGSKVWADGNRRDDLCWTLTFSPSMKYPNAFGANLVQGEQATIIHGKWDALARTVEVEEMVDDPCKYTGTLIYQHDEQHGDLWILRGVWSCGSEEGTFLACKEPEDDKTHISGLWIGTAYPDESLAPFLIPTNPIRWCLSFLTNSSNKTAKSAFGSGYLDDAADVPNKPLLFYSLVGQYAAFSFSVQKLYEATPETAGYEVEYKGSLSYDEEKKSYKLEGTWKNEKGKSFGRFICAKQPASTNLTSHIVVCELCSVCITPGETRWCREAEKNALPWTCCIDCHVSRPLDPSFILHPSIMVDSKSAKGKCTASLFRNAFECFSARPFLTFRRLNTDSSWHVYTYSDIFRYCNYLLSGLEKIFKGEKRPRVAFCATLSPSLLMSMIACFMRGYILVPIHAALDKSSIGSILEKSEAAICFFDYSSKETILDLTTSDTCLQIELIPEFDSQHGIPPSQMEIEAPYRLDAILSTGQEINPTGAFDPSWSPMIISSDVVAILYTSGSTGVPKGAIFTEELAFPTEGSTTVLPFIRIDFQSFDPSLILSIASSMQYGGSRILSTKEFLMEDIAVTRPTHIGATPVFWNSLFQEFLVCVHQKENQMGLEGREMAEIEIAQDMRKKLGNRLYVATSGGAPISKQVLEFAKDFLKLDIVDLYGSRECGGITRDGVVYPGVTVYLRSLPELGYYNDGVPPRGEICVASPRLIPGYWNDEERTKAAFMVVDGVSYYCTGDVGELSVDGEKQMLRVIDRASFVFKLAQGEWISPGKIETLIEQCPWVDQAFVFGSSSYAFPVAIIVPSKLLFAHKAFQLLHENSKSEELIQNATQKILNEIRFWLSHNHLRLLETPQSVRLEFDRWTPENGFLTSTLKKKRNLLKVRYSPFLEDLASCYRGDFSGDSLSPAFLDLLFNVFGSHVKVNVMTMFAEIGDSLMAVKFVKRMREARVCLTNQSVYEYSFGHLSNLMDVQEHGTVTPLPKTCTLDWTQEWNLDSHLSIQEKKTITSRKHAKTSERRAILVTGCTGFMGPILLSQILEQYPDRKIYGLVRKSRSMNYLRMCMEEAFVWQENFTDRIQSVPGDLSQPQLGLADDVWCSLVEELSDIFHSGAWVNMSLPYSTLRSTNVQSTIDIIRMALLYDVRVHYISSISALGSNQEEEWQQLSNREMDQKGGYGQTKAVCERLLYDAHMRYHLDVRIFRPGTISGDTRSGHSNLFDFTNLVLFSCLSLGAAVRNTPFSLSWIPVDFVGKAIVGIARQVHSNGKIFHFCGSTPTLETVLQLLEEKGVFFRDISSMEWKALVMKLPDTHLASPLRGVLQALEWDTFPQATPTQKTQKYLSETLHMPPQEITEETISKYLDFFISKQKTLESLGITFSKKDTDA